MAGVVKNKFGIRLAVAEITPIVKEKLTKASPFDPFEKLLWDNLIGVDVSTVKRCDESRVFVKRFHLKDMDLAV